MILTSFVPFGVTGADHGSSASYTHDSIGETVASTDRKPAVSDRKPQSANGSGSDAIETVHVADDEYTVESGTDSDRPVNASGQLASTATETPALPSESIAVEIDETDSPVVSGEPMSINATVTNTFHRRVTVTVSLEIDGNPTEDVEIDLEKNATANVSLTWETPPSADGGYVATVSVGRNEVNDIVSVVHPQSVDIEHSGSGSTNRYDTYADKRSVKRTSGGDHVVFGGNARNDIRISNPRRASR